jgi:hypothetical protein
MSIKTMEIWEDIKENSHSSWRTLQSSLNQSFLIIKNITNIKEANEKK